MAQTSGFDPAFKVKTCFDCKMFDVANWVACLNGKDGPGGTPSNEALSVSPQGALEISSVFGQPPSLIRDHFLSSPKIVAKSHKCDDGCTPSSPRPQYPSLYRLLKRRLDRSFRASLYKRAVIILRKKATYKCSRVEGSLSSPARVQEPVPKPDCSGYYGQLNSSSRHKQTGRNPLSGDVRSSAENHDLVPSLSDNSKSQTHSRVSTCDG